MTANVLDSSWQARNMKYYVRHTVTTIDASEISIKLLSLVGTTIIPNLIPNITLLITRHQQKASNQILRLRCPEHRPL